MVLHRNDLVLKPFKYRTLKHVDSAINFNTNRLCKKLNLVSISGWNKYCSDEKKQELIRGRNLKELRRRIIYDESLRPGEAAVPKNLKEELGIEDTVEIVVARKKRLIFKVKEVESDVERVLVCPEDMKPLGIADNSIATIRRPIET